ncbi:hypothetical protein H4R35_007110 [Dimargaris xerosporica]|nr:hypothetical protein H4R35_007110 [Dimargaris xerosporica]
MSFFSSSASSHSPRAQGWLRAPGPPAGFMGNDCPLCDDNTKQLPSTSPWLTAAHPRSPPSEWIMAPCNESAHDQSPQRHGKFEWATEISSNVLAPISTDVNTTAQGLIVTMRWPPSRQPAEVHHAANDHGLEIWAIDRPQATKYVLFVRTKHDAKVFSRHMAIPEGFDREKYTFDYKDGVLKAMFPRKAPMYTRQMR